MTHRPFLPALALLLAAALPAADIALAGSAGSGYFSTSNIKNWGSEPIPPQPYNMQSYFPYFQRVAGQDRPGLWTSIAAVPLSAASTYLEEAVPGVAVRGRDLTQADFATFSAGTISYPDGLITGSGREVIPASALTLSINSTGFSPIHSAYNELTRTNPADVGQFGWGCTISVTALSGEGLRFIDGVLASIDLDADLEVALWLMMDDPFFYFQPATADGDPDTDDAVATGEAGLPGSLRIRGSRYAFALDAEGEHAFVSLFGAMENVTVRLNRAGDIAAVTPRPLTVSGLTVQDKLYDRTTAAVADAAAAVLAGDIDPADAGEVALDAGALSAAFATAAVGSRKPVTIAGLALSGPAASAYTLVMPAATASIAPRPLTVAGLSAQDKIHDGTTAAVITGTPSLVGVLSGDAVALSGTPVGAFADAAVGAAKPVSVSGLAINHPDYSLTAPTLSAAITAAPGIVVGLSASPTQLFATEETVYTWTFTLSEPPPAGGVAIKLWGSENQIINQWNIFDVLNPANLSGLDGMPTDISPGLDFSAFRLVIVDQVAEMRMRMYHSPDVPTPKVVTWYIAPLAGCTVDPAADRAQVTLYRNRGEVGGPELDISRGTAVIPDGYALYAGEVVHTDAVAGTRSGQEEVLEYVLTNVGSADLHVGATAISAAANCAAAVVDAPDAIVPPAGSTVLRIAVTPAAGGAWSFAVAVASDDADENPYDWRVAGTATGPNLAVSRSGTPIADGADDPVALAQGTPAILAYALANAGTEALALLAPVAIEDAVNCAPTILAQPPPSIAAAGVEHLEVRLAAIAAGDWSFALRIASDDPDEPAYRWTVSGTVVAPELDVLRGATAIAAGGVDAVTGSAPGVPSTLTYVLANTGNAPLSLTAVALAAADNCAPVVVGSAPTAVAAGGSAALTIEVTPTASGAWSFAVSIASDDADEDPYRWTVGNGAIPDLAVDRDGTAIAAEGADAVGLLAVGVEAPLSYRLRNRGTGDLGITLAAVGELVNCTAVVVAAPTDIAAAGEAWLDLGIVPLAAGPWSCRVTVGSSDPDEDPYRWTISGGGAAPELDVSRNGAGIASGGGDAIAGSQAGQAVVLTYAVVNSGLADLALGEAAIAATANCSATITLQPATALAPYAASALRLSIVPAAGGAWSAAVSLPSDDADESPYGWTISGTATAADLQVARGAAAIASGGDDVISGTAAGAETVLTYTLSSQGSGPVHLTAPVTIAAVANCTVRVLTLPAETIAAGTSSALSIGVTPSGGGWRVQFEVRSTDADQPSYAWSASGSAAGGGSGDADGSGDSDSGFGGCGAGSALALLGLPALARLRRRREGRG